MIPATIYAAINYNTETAAGWGIPMATDIAFALAVIAMLGKNVPASLKIFLAALAIVDDLGAILVIAIFYTEQIHWQELYIAVVIVAALFTLNCFKINYPGASPRGIGGKELIFSFMKTLCFQTFRYNPEASLEVFNE